MKMRMHCANLEAQYRPYLHRPARPKFRLNSPVLKTSVIARSGEKDDTSQGSALEFFDQMIEAQRNRIQDYNKLRKEINASLQEAKDGGIPRPVIGIVAWLFDLSDSLNQYMEWQLSQMEKQREAIAQLGETNVQDPWNAEYAGQSVDNEMQANVEAAAIIFVSILNAVFFSWLVSWFGVELSPILPGPTLPTTNALAVWAFWTVPYIGATLAAGVAMGPAWIANRGCVRYVARDLFYEKASIPALASVAVAASYSRSIIYQGSWLLYFQSALLAPALLNSTDSLRGWEEESLQHAMGSLVASPGFGVLIAKPASLLLSAVVEAVYWMVEERTRFLEDPTEILFETNKRPSTVDGKVDNQPTSENEEVTLQKDLQQAWERMKNVYDVKSVQLTEMSSDEYLLTGGRIFLSSLWLGSETLATGNLWFSVCTGATGLVAAFTIRRRDRFISA